MKSTCCKSTVRIVGKTTLHYECDACGQPCDVMDEATAIDQLREYWRENSMARIIDGDLPPSHD